MLLLLLLITSITCAAGSVHYHDDTANEVMGVISWRGRSYYENSTKHQCYYSAYHNSPGSNMDSGRWQASVFGWIRLFNTLR